MINTDIKNITTKIGNIEHIFLYISWLLLKSNIWIKCREKRLSHEAQIMWYQSRISKIDYDNMDKILGLLDTLYKEEYWLTMYRVETPLECFSKMNTYLKILHDACK